MGSWISMEDDEKNNSPTNAAAEDFSRISTEDDEKNNSPTNAAAEDFSRRDAAATIHISNIGEDVTEDALWRFCLQAGPVVDMHIYKDRETKRNKGYAFVEFESKNDVKNAIEKLHMKKLCGKPLWISEDLDLLGDS